MLRSYECSKSVGYNDSKAPQCQGPYYTYTHCTHTQLPGATSCDRFCICVMPWVMLVLLHLVALTVITGACCTGKKGFVLR